LPRQAFLLLNTPAFAGHTTGRADLPHPAFRLTSQGPRRGPLAPACLALGSRLRLAIELSRRTPDLLGLPRLIANRPGPRRLRKHARSQGPSLRRRYPASTVLFPCPTPARSIAQTRCRSRNLRTDGSPPITRIALPTCRFQYPDGPNGCARRLLPRSRGLPRAGGGSASISSLSRPARTSLALRPVGLLDRPRRPLSRGSDPAGCPAKPLVSYQVLPTTSWVDPPSTGESRRWGALRSRGLSSPVDKAPVIVVELRHYDSCNKIKKSHPATRSPKSAAPLGARGCGIEACE
jgi:hypothetical protein